MTDASDSSDESSSGGPESSKDGDASGANESNQGSEVFGQQIRHRQLSARVPDEVGRGVFSTGAIVLTGASEFVLDFLVRMARPYQVAARVIMPHAALIQFSRALNDNIDKYANRFGEIPAMPKGDPDAKRPSIQEIYDDLKLPDEQLSGVYANACIIGHSPAEFVFDFVANFFPRSAVSARVYMSSRQAPQLLKGLEHSAQQLEQRRKQAQERNQSPDSSGPTAQEDTPPDDDRDRKRRDDTESGDSDLMY